MERMERTERQSSMLIWVKVGVHKYSEKRRELSLR